MNKSLLKKLNFIFLIIIIVSITLVGCVETTPDPPFAVTYSAETGGCVSGETTQTLGKDNVGSFVTAHPHDGYLFSGWSDGVMGATRQEKNNKGTLASTVPYPTYDEKMSEIIWEKDFGKDIKISATFVSKTKTLNYEYNNATANNSEQNITLSYDNIKDASFIIPSRENYIFGGWYLDSELTVKVTNENGIYYLGRSVFFSNSNTIYAKWTNTETTTFKILLVFAEEIHAELKTVEGTIIPVDYKMPLIERKICELIPKQLSKYLNSWFDGFINFEIDGYFATTPLGNESFSAGMTSMDQLAYSCDANDMPEMGPILKDYRSITVTINMNDHDSLLHSGGGLASIKYAMVNLESSLGGAFVNYIPLETYLDTNCTIRWEELLGTYIHEFTHTVEKGLDVYAYHEIFGHYNTIGVPTLEATKLYLLNQAVIDGVTVGIPSGFWNGEFDVYVNLIPNTIDFKRPGKVAIVGSEEPEFPWIDYVSIKVPFGSDLTVEAIPKEGFRFSHWSDGVTTALRHDTNIISYLNVKAIFVKIYV